MYLILLLMINSKSLSRWGISEVVMEEIILSKLKVKLLDNVELPFRLNSESMDVSYLFSNWDVFEKAVSLILVENDAEISTLQIKLRLSYNQASLLIEYMEYLGLIGSYEFGRKRKIYIEPIAK